MEDSFLEASGRPEAIIITFPCIEHFNEMLSQTPPSSDLHQILEAGSYPVSAAEQAEINVAERPCLWRSQLQLPTPAPNPGPAHRKSQSLPSAQAAFFIHVLFWEFSRARGLQSCFSGHGQTGRPGD